jgi:hypothetical protein
MRLSLSLSVAVAALSFGTAFAEAPQAGAVTNAASAPIALSPALLQPEKAKARGNPFKSERFSEDWTAMGDEANRTRPWHDLKHLPLGDAGYVSFGGDLRLRYESIDAPGFGLTGLGADDYLTQRAMTHMAFGLNGHVRGFVQLGVHDGIGREARVTHDDSHADLQQAFLEVSNEIGDGKAGVRLGRQELALSPRFHTARDGVNIRAAFDGLRTYYTQGPLRVDVWAVRPVLLRRGAFDDRPDGNFTFDGLRVQYGFGQDRALTLSGMLFKHQRERFKLNTTTAKDDRYSLGARLQGKVGAFDFDVENYLQTGTFGNRDIEAHGGGGDFGFTFADAAMAPKIGVRWLYGSGDSNGADVEVNTFVGPSTRTICCADTLWLNASNVAILSPLVAFKPMPRLTLEAKVDFNQRLEKGDALYAWPASAYAVTPGTPGDDLVSIAPTVSFAWTPSDETTIQGWLIQASADGALANAGGRDTTFSAISLALRF